MYQKVYDLAKDLDILRRPIVNYFNWRFRQPFIFLEPMK